MVNRIINVGLIGYGYWGPNLLRNVASQPNCRIVACCDKNPQRLHQVQERYPGINVFDNHFKLLKAPEIDAVIIATPVFTHYALALQALSHGKHVFVEKPLAASSLEVLDLIESAKARNLTLMVGHTFLYSSPVNKIKQLIDDGELGQIYYISSTRVNLGIHQSDVSVIWDLAPHDFSIIFYLLEEEPIEISANGRDFIQKGLHDVAFIDLMFPSGAVAHVQDSWLSPSKRRHMTIVGSEKMVIYDDSNLEEQVKIFNKSVDYINDPASFGEHQLTYRVGDITIPRLQAQEPLSVEMNHFIDCIQSGRTPKTDGFHGLTVVRAIEAADWSLKQGGRKLVLEHLDVSSVDNELDEILANQGASHGR